MANQRKNWTRSELILALRLYYWTPFGKMHRGNPEVIQLAQLIGRTTNSVALKLVNFAHIDPDLDREGMKGASKLDRQIWAEFYQKWETLALEAEDVLGQYQSITKNLVEEETVPYLKAGEETERWVKTRRNQYFFRKTLLASYDGTCCITGLQRPELLIAGHIKPWAEDVENRLNPTNGILINALHDKAFENGLITIDKADYTIKVSSEITQSKDDQLKPLFLPYQNQKIQLPEKYKYLPGKEFLEYHNDVRFRK